MKLAKLCISPRNFENKKFEITYLLVYFTNLCRNHNSQNLATRALKRRKLLNLSIFSGGAHACVALYLHFYEKNAFIRIVFNKKISNFGWHFFQNDMKMR